MSPRAVRLSSQERAMLDAIVLDSTPKVTEFYGRGGPRLLTLGFIERRFKDGRNTYHVTPKGFAFLAPPSASPAKTLSPRAIAARARNKFKLKPGESIQTRGVLAGAYADRDLSSTLTHSLILDDKGRDVGVLCKRVKLDSLADEMSEPTGRKPTCPVCLARDPRFG